MYSVELDEDHIDPDAAKVVRRLVRHGYEAYLVGGCVRDLLVKARPKDFDVVTNARPDDVRRLFRNSRIIGRRFRLVHVLFGAGKVIETATFRRAPEESARGGTEDLLIRNDNVFGEAPQDAQRRDFTINALFYDIERRQMLDWVGGMPDIERRSVHTIGNPVTRFLEDPVRLLRAIKFSARLDLGITPEVYDAIVGCRHALRRAAKPRLFEEMLRLMRGGAAHRAIYIAWETGVLDVLLPELSTYLADREDGDDTVRRILSRSIAARASRALPSTTRCSAPCSCSSRSAKPASASATASKPPTNSSSRSSIASTSRAASPSPCAASPPCSRASSRAASGASVAPASTNSRVKSRRCAACRCLAPRRTRKPVPARIRSAAGSAAAVAPVWASRDRRRKILCPAAYERGRSHRMRGFLRGAVVCAWLGFGCSSSGDDSPATTTPGEGQGGSATGGGGSSGAATGGRAAGSGGTSGPAAAGSGGNSAGGNAGSANAGTGSGATAGAGGNGAGGSAGATGGSGGTPAMEWPWPSYDDAKASPKSTRLLVVLLDFNDSDVATLIPEPEPAWSKLIFGTAQAQGNHYWYETSAGQFQLLPAQESSGVADNGVARVKLASARPTDGQFVVEQQTWIPEALDQLATDVDFDAFDTNGDGTLQNTELSVLFILNLPYAQINGAGAQANILLSHPIAGSGVVLDKFARSQVDYSSIGTPMHELGHHILDLDHGPQPSEHDLMGLGAYNEDPVITTLHDPNSHYATRPAGLGGLNKIAAGFVAPTRITETTRGLKLYAPETGKMYNVLELPVQDGFLYLENRTAWGYDRSIPFCDGAAGGLFAVDASQYMSPLNFPAIESRPPLASFDSPDEIFCDYYALAGHNAPVSFGGWQLENVSEAGPVMTLDLVKTDAPRQHRALQVPLLDHQPEPRRLPDVALARSAAERQHHHRFRDVPLGRRRRRLLHNHPRGLLLHGRSPLRQQGRRLDQRLLVRLHQPAHDHHEPRLAPRRRHHQHLDRPERPPTPTPPPSARRSATSKRASSSSTFPLPDWLRTRERARHKAKGGGRYPKRRTHHCSRASPSLERFSYRHRRHGGPRAPGDLGVPDSGRLRRGSRRVLVTPTRSESPPLNPKS